MDLRRIAVLLLSTCSTFATASGPAAGVETLVSKVTIQREPLSSVLGHLPGGEMVFVKRVKPHLGNTVFARGPLEIWDPVEGRKLRDVLTVDDEISESPMRFPGTVVICRKGEWLVVEVANGNVLYKLEAKGRVKGLIPLPGRNWVVYLDDDVLRCRDVELNSEVWTASGFSDLCMPIGSRYILAMRTLSENEIGSGYCYLETETGRVDHRFDRFGDMITVVASSDDRFLSINKIDECIVCDGESLEKRWSMPLEFLDIIQFNEAGNELRATYLDEDGKISTARWEAATGLVLSPKPLFKRTQNLVRIDFYQSHYAIDRMNWRDNPLNRQGLPGKRETDTYRVVDKRTEDAIALIEGLPRGVMPQLLPDGKGIVTVYDECIEYYALPSLADP